MTDHLEKWYAVHTRSRFEQKVYDGIMGKSIEAFLPRVQTMSRRKDRKKKIYIPLIPGYVFVRFDLNPERVKKSSYGPSSRIQAVDTD